MTLNYYLILFIYFCAPFREESKIPGNQLVECHECHSLYHQVKQHLVYTLIKGVIIIHCGMCVVGSRLIYHVSHLIHFVCNSWHHRCYPTLSHKVWETWTSDELNKFLEVYFEFPFKMIDQSNYAFLTGQSWQVLQSCHTAGAQNKDFGPCSQMDLTRAQLLEGRLALNPWLI